MTYVPDFSDLIWAQRKIANTRDGGVIAYPNSKLLYRVDKTRRVWKLLNPEILIDLTANELNEATKSVLAFINWEVE